MSKIAFFCIPAHGHTNPTLEVVKELIHQGHEVRYYSYECMREKIASTGAEYFSCEEYDFEQKLTPADGKRIAEDMSFAIEILVNSTLAMDAALSEQIKQWNPDCIVADSMALWGKCDGHGHVYAHPHGAHFCTDCKMIEDAKVLLCRCSKGK